MRAFCFWIENKSISHLKNDISWSAILKDWKIQYGWTWENLNQRLDRPKFLVNMLGLCSHVLLLNKRSSHRMIWIFGIVSILVCSEKMSGKRLRFFLCCWESIRPLLSFVSGFFLETLLLPKGLNRTQFSKIMSHYYCKVLSSNLQKYQNFSRFLTARDRRKLTAEIDFTSEIK